MAAEPISLPLTTAVYLRVSSEEQKQQGTIETQRSAIERWLTVSDEHAQWYADDGVSGTVPLERRPEGARLLADVRAGRISRVVCWRLDRMGRNAKGILDVVDALKAAGCNLVSTTEAFDLSTPAGQLQLNMLAAIAQFERDSIVQRAGEGNTRRLASTAYMGGRPSIGYRVEGRKRDARLALRDTPDPASGYSEVDVVRLAWRLCVEDGLCTLDIANRLTALGIPTRSGGKRWQESVVYHMLTTTVSRGEYVYTRKDGTVHTERVPAILTVEEWDRAQAALAAHKRYSHRNIERPYLLRDLMRCGTCGETMIGSYNVKVYHDGSRHGEWRFYCCPTRHQARMRQRRGEPYRTCGTLYVDADKLEAAIWTDVEAYVRDPGAALTRLAARRGTEQHDTAATRAELATLDAQLANFQAERDSVLALFRKGRISERDLDHQLDAIEREESATRKARVATLARLDAGAATEQRLDSARALLQRLHARLDSGPLSEATRVEVVRALVAEIRVETVDAGLSQRGRVKRESVVHVTYTFDDPAQQHHDVDASPRLFVWSS
jgi:site-specific DNA recombinase